MLRLTKDVVCNANVCLILNFISFRVLHAQKKLILEDLTCKWIKRKPY